MLLSLFSLLILLKLLRLSTSVDYCKLPRPMCEVGDEQVPHLMCTYPKAGPSKKCIDHQSDSFSEDMKNRIVTRHNQIRNTVALGRVKDGSPGPQPPAADMLQMSWDNEMQVFAQRWVDQCIKPSDNPHDECRDTEDTWIGQNVALVEYDNNDHVFAIFDELIRDFLDEVVYFNKDLVKNFTEDLSVMNSIGNYAQIVWAESNLVGCAHATYKIRSRQNTRLVCNYSPSGVAMNEPVYTIGAACLRCPIGTSCSERYPALCATAEQLNGKDLGGGIPKERLQGTPYGNASAGTIKKMKRGVWKNQACYCLENIRSRATVLPSIHYLILLVLLCKVIITSLCCCCD